MARTFRINHLRLSAFLLVAALGVGCSKSVPESKPAAAAPKSDAASASAPAQPSAPAPIPEGALVVEGITPGKKGGKLVMSLTGDVKTFNPVLAEDVDSTQLSDFLFSRLYDYDRTKQESVPALAKSWEYNEERQEWTFRLRENLKWSDGEPLTAGDCVFFSEVIFDPSVSNIHRDGMQFEGKPYEFSAPDPLTLVVKIPGVDSFSFVNLIECRPLPRHRLEKALKEGKFAEALGTNARPEEIIGSGAFTLKSFASGEKVVLAANPHYFKYDKNGTRLPYMDEVIVLAVPDFEAMAIRFMAHDTDLLERIQPQSLGMIARAEQEDPTFKLFNPGIELSVTHFWFNLRPGGTYENEAGKRVVWDAPSLDAEPPPEIRKRGYRPFLNPIKRKWFENEDFRKACSMAVDRDAIVRTVLYGEGIAVYGNEYVSNTRWVSGNIAKFPHDPEKAAALLDGLGFSDRDKDGLREDKEGNVLRFTLISNKENKVRDKVAVLMKEDFRKLGIDMIVQMLDFNDVVTRNNDTSDYEACLLGLASGVPPHPAQASNIWLSFSRMHTWHPSQKTPARPWEAELDKLYLDMKRTFDYAEQKRLYDEMQRIYSEHQPVIHLFSLKQYLAASNKLGNLRPSVIRPYLTHNIEELCWK